MSIRPWKIVSSIKVKAYEIFTLRKDQARSPRTGNVHDFYVLETTDWVNIIPITKKNEVVLVRQYRHGIQDVTLEIPGGIIENNDSPEIAARRELREETGYMASEMIFLGTVLPNPAFLNNRCYTYLAPDVIFNGELEQDDKEDIEVVLRPAAEIPQLIQSGEICHSLIIAAFYRFLNEYGNERL